MHWQQHWPASSHEPHRLRTLNLAKDLQAAQAQSAESQSCQQSLKHLLHMLLSCCRLHECLSTSSLALLAAAVPAGCSCLQELDLSCNTLVAATGPSTCITTCARTDSNSSSGGSSMVDHAWPSFIDALVQPCCPQLQALVLSSCSLGAAAAAALTRLLRAKSRSTLQQLRLAQCAGMGEVRLGWLAMHARV
jgi:hypothetical protein